MTAPTNAIPQVETKFLTESPIRIYVLWHPDFDRPDLKGRKPGAVPKDEEWQIDAGLRIARQIYHWFRLENMEGIPVYFRSASAPGTHQPLDIDAVVGTNYFIPLVDANMVASPEWRGYVRGLAARAASCSGCREVLLPVAVDPVAYNMPAELRQLNFIRHDMTGKGLPDPDALLSRLTEIICRDLRDFLNRRNPHEPSAGGPPGKLKVFLSHAKADGTEEALAIKDYLYRKTQCEAFFDETDIASGYNFESILGTAVELESAGLFVIQGDHYADRPWCRKEIRDFLKPMPDTVVNLAAPSYFIPPVVVVQTMRGERVARSIPELGHAPIVRWTDGKSARFMVTTLLREILLGLFYRLISRDLAADPDAKKFLFINRTPDPVMVDRILAGMSDNVVPDAIAHPGYGLSAMDRMCLGVAFPKLKFVPFSEIPASETPKLPTLDHRVISVSAGNSPDILTGGAGDEHNQELLRRLLRPLFRAGASVLYGGALPTSDQPAEPWSDRVNFTRTLLDLLLSERDSGSRKDPSNARLYNLSAWPYSEKITPRIRAQWTDICSFIPIGWETAGLGPPAEEPSPISDGELDGLPALKRTALRAKHAKELAEWKARRNVTEAGCLSVMRKMAASTDRIGPVAPDWSNKLNPPAMFKTTLAHIFLGGKIQGAAGIMPGIFEEAIHAFDNRKPTFILHAGYGAAGLLATWLADADLKKRPLELTLGFYQENAAFAELNDRLNQLRKAGGWDPERFMTPKEGLDRLWAHIQHAKSNGLGALLNNTLSEDDNRELLVSDNYAKICQRVWEGIAGVIQKTVT